MAGKIIAAAACALVALVACAQTVHSSPTSATLEPRVHHDAWVAPTPAPTPAPTAAPTPEPTDAPTEAPAAPVIRPASPPPPPAAPPAPPAAAPGNYSATEQQVLINQDRANAGLPPLAWSPCLGGNAQRVANRIAADNALNEPYSDLQADLNCGYGDGAGENEGWCSCGINDGYMNQALMNSPDHRANILGSNYRFVGTAWATASNGYGYLAEEFG